MPDIFVTLKSNVQLDDNGNFVEDEQGELQLVNEEAIGLLQKTHCIQVTHLNQETQQIEVGARLVSEVFWEHERSPAPAMVAPEDLAWISMDQGDGDVDDENQDNEPDDNQVAESEDDGGYF